MNTALYRRYRPENFAEVIGQDHVTNPLRQALRANRVNHAYLFSGPRGCGKTTSARILARILNCAENTPENPTDTPCGRCPSCVELARNGSGSLDVVEIDAASHGGVDDARELRERATFSPSRDRYKIFILDEAHMVTPQGFNALLKIVEEPPEYLKFIFATTEPDKVIGTIRSRTHHYPFKLVAPQVMHDYMAEVCVQEKISIAPGVLPLVVRAGGGSVRDSLSVLDQLISGASDAQLDYDLAASLLGYTKGTILVEAVDALLQNDGAALFEMVARVIETGQEPRRFVEDLLQRLRDLLLLALSGVAGERLLPGIGKDQLQQMLQQADAFGATGLTKSAEIVNDTLTQMVGASAPRIQLEIMCAKLLLVDADAVATPARLAASSAPATPAPVAPAVAAVPTVAVPSVAPEVDAHTKKDATILKAATTFLGASARNVEPEPEPAPAPAPEPEPAPAPAPEPEPKPAPEPEPEQPVSLDAAKWTEVVALVTEVSRLGGIVLESNASPGNFDGKTLVVEFTNQGALASFEGRGQVTILKQALERVLGKEIDVIALVGDGKSASKSAPLLPQDPQSEPELEPEPAPAPEPEPAPAPAPEPEPAPAPEPEPAPEPAPASAPKLGKTVGSLARAVKAATKDAELIKETQKESQNSDAGAVNTSLEARLANRLGSFERPAANPPAEAVDPFADDDPQPDDVDITDSPLVGVPVIIDILGAKVIPQDDELP